MSVSVTAAPALAVRHESESDFFARLKINTTLSLARCRCDAVGRRAVFTKPARVHGRPSRSFRDTHQASVDGEQGQCQAKCPDLTQRRLAKPDAALLGN